MSESTMKTNRYVVRHTVLMDTAVLAADPADAIRRVLSDDCGCEIQAIKLAQPVPVILNVSIISPCCVNLSAGIKHWTDCPNYDLTLSAGGAVIAFPGVELKG